LENIVADVYHVKGKYNLVVADYSSKYQKVICLDNVKNYFIEQFKRIFSMFGVPYKLVLNYAASFV
jgi:hypothetical protein